MDAGRFLSSRYVQSNQFAAASSRPVTNQWVTDVVDTNAFQVKLIDVGRL